MGDEELAFHGDVIGGGIMKGKDETSKKVEVGVELGRESGLGFHGVSEKRI